MYFNSKDTLNSNLMAAKCKLLKILVVEEHGIECEQLESFNFVDHSFHIGNLTGFGIMMLKKITLHHKH